MSVGDDAEEFISIHALGRKMLLGLSCGLPSHPLKIMFRPLEDDRELLPQFSTYQPSLCGFNRSLAGARHKSPAVE